MVIARRRQAGQHLAEFTFVIGVAAIAAMSMMHLARQAVQRGAQSASDTVLGPPTAREGCKDTDEDGLCNCEDTDLDNECDELDVQATSKVTETGTGGGRRTTQLDDTVVGRASGRFERDIAVPIGRVFGTEGRYAIPRPGGQAVPRPSGSPTRRVQRRQQEGS